MCVSAIFYPRLTVFFGLLNHVTFRLANPDELRETRDLRSVILFKSVVTAVLNITQNYGADQKGFKYIQHRAAMTVTTAYWTLSSADPAMNYVN